jgi:hypothetical protein
LASGRAILAAEQRRTKVLLGGAIVRREYSAGRRSVQRSDESVQGGKTREVSEPAALRMGMTGFNSPVQKKVKGKSISLNNDEAKKEHHY